MFVRWLVALLILTGSAASALSQVPFRGLRTIAGNGESSRARDQAPALETSLSNPFGVQPMPDGSLIIASFDQHVLYRLDPSYNRLELICGTGTAGLSGSGGEHPTNVALNRPHEVQIDAQGNIYVADTYNHRVGKIDAATGRWSVVAGTGSAGFSGDRHRATDAQLNEAYSIALDDQDLYIADMANHRIRHVDLRSGVIQTICGNGVQAMPVDGQLALMQSLAGPRSLAVDTNYLWVVLREGNSVWKIDRRDGKIYHVAGTGQKGFSGDEGEARLAQFNGPKGIAVQPGIAAFVADTENHAIRRIDLRSGRIATVIGSAQGEGGFNGDGDNLTQRLLKRPHGVCLLPSGALLIGDSENHRLRLAE